MMLQKVHKDKCVNKTDFVLVLLVLVLVLYVDQCECLYVNKSLN